MSPLGSKRFCFECGPELDCFTACCARLNLQLTPYDIVRLSRRLQLSTTEFLDRYTTAVDEPGKFTRVALMMDEKTGRCPFVTDQGCNLYEDRPGACRTYPLARASTSQAGKTRAAYFVIRENHCHGFERSKEWSAEEWTADQDMETYDELNDQWMEIVTRQKSLAYSQGRDQRERMFNLASYDLDQFRQFVFDGGLLDRLELSPRVVEQLKTDDVRLLRFAFAWMRLALFGEMTGQLTRP
jgi:Fe-S-cluster containining protein